MEDVLSFSREDLLSEDRKAGILTALEVSARERRGIPSPSVTAGDGDATRLAATSDRGVRTGGRED